MLLILEIVVFIIFSSSIPCLTYPKRHKKAFFLYLIILPIPSVVLFNFFIDEGFSLNRVDVSTGLACAIVFSLNYWITTGIIKLLLKFYDLKVYSRIIISVIIIMLNFLLFIIWFYIVFAVGYWINPLLPKFDFYFPI